MVIYGLSEETKKGLRFKTEISQKTKVIAEGLTNQKLFSESEKYHNLKDVKDILKDLKTIKKESLKGKIKIYTLYKNHGETVKFEKIKKESILGFKNINEVKKILPNNKIVIDEEGNFIVLKGIQDEINDLINFLQNCAKSKIGFFHSIGFVHTEGIDEEDIKLLKKE